jgi:hypothetical protein
VIAPGETYQQILADFSEETAPDDDSDAINRAADR